MADFDLSRRHFIQTFGAGLGTLWLTTAMPMQFSFAATPDDRRLLLVVLRGALDGLGAIIPYSDPAYAQARGGLAIAQSDKGLIALDSNFAMHTALEPLSRMYKKNELVVVHAVATPYRDRSHFDAQNLLENGSNKAHALPTGWLGRAVVEMGNTSGKAIALGPTVPLVLRGDKDVSSWTPSVLPEVDEDLLGRIMHLYQNDPAMLDALNGAEEMKGLPDDMMKGGGQKAFISMMKKAAEFMTSPNGPRVGSIDIGGWDTHQNQGLETGRLANNLKILAEGIETYRIGMGEAWKKTAVLVVTEFGRTVHVNGTGGTDHGTGGVAFLAGGCVKGGRVIGDWPGLQKLYEDRDLIPANDLRSLLKTTLQMQLGLSEEQLSKIIFPGSQSVASYQSLNLIE